eukprot:gene15363-17577_t
MTLKLKLNTLILFCIAIVLGSTLSFDGEVQRRLASTKGVVAFYNVYANGTYFDEIVLTQVKTIDGSGLLNQLDHVFYATNGEQGQNYIVSNSSKYVHIAHFEKDGGELQTINMLYRFCNANPNVKVLYFHNKGSHHYTEKNQEFVKLLNCYVLNTHCIEALNDHDTCGWRISPFPVPHYSGNFWWARCSYVNTLIHPLAQTNNQTFIKKTQSLNNCVGMKDRLFAEFWIGTGLSYLPADCMNATIDTSFVFPSTRFIFPKAVYDYCYGPDKPSGLPCQTASTYKDSHLFKDTIRRVSRGYKEPECRDNYEEIVKSSRIMYGQDPHTYIEWMERLYNKVNLTENSMVRFRSNAQVYIARGNALRGVPNLKTFLTFGKEFNDVRVVPDTSRYLYRFGEHLPSA